MKRWMYSLFVLAVMQSCVKTDDFDVPEFNSEVGDFKGQLTSIAAVKGNYKPDTGEIVNFQNTDTWFEAYVISDDSGGNFYKELILQDKPENPTAGIQVLLDDNSVFETFNFGRKVFVKLDGLSLGYNNGVLQLGIQNRGDIVAIPGSLIDDHIQRTSETAEIIPKHINISEFAPELKNLYVKLENIQFDLNLVRDQAVYSFASNVVDQYDAFRQMESCETGETVFLSTSTFSNFRSLILPSGTGSVEGIFTRDFFDENYVIMLNNPEGLVMDGERCDPEYLDCGNATDEGSKIVFEENFEGVTSNTTLNARRWTNVNMSGGETKFKPTLSNGNRILRISAYNTNESPLEVWLITPQIDLTTSNNEVLSFDLLSSYDRGLLLEVYVTENYRGDIATTNWTEVDANIPLGPSGANSRVFTTSKIDISCLEKVWVAFRYLGAAPDKTTTYDLDNVKVTGD